MRQINQTASEFKNAVRNAAAKKFNAVKRTLSAAGVFCAAGFIAFAAGQTSNQVIINTDGAQKTVYTMRTSAESILAQNFIPVGDNDEVLCLYDDTGSITEIVIHSAFDVTIEADGTETTVEMVRGTVADAFKKADITVGEYDTVNYALTDEVTPDMHIVLTRVEIVVTVTTEPVAYETKYYETTLLKDGQTKVERAGVNGEKTITVTETYSNGVLVDTKTKEKVTLKPVTAKVIVGNSDAPPLSSMVFDDIILDENGIPTEYTQLIVGEATAYGANDGNKTSTGVKPAIGYIAVNPKVIPYGSRLYIRSVDGKHIYGFAIAADTGPSVLKNITVADLFLGSEVEIDYWGRRDIEIYILP
ncbi:MAG TPA: ubiquitin-like domain-containing protein [Oscillospiraceae bacterium]|nr:ubiquitin-like domain-containing protein [Oscillospiraceae bacterium]HPK34523.1 ubiquitin-like domain-containing protein [Oscillospiraceae bacterium]HPR74751.1 ubiquitin-like domain-containing protein [Oscillospiraceae bacterium]